MTERAVVNLPAPISREVSAPTNPKLPRMVTWVATAGAVLTGAWHGIVAIVTGSRVDVDVGLALNVLTVIAVVWYTYFTRQTLEHGRWTANEAYRRAELQRQGNRAALATAVLGELFNISARLKSLSKYGPSAGPAEIISHPILELAMSQPHHFDAATVHSIAASVRQIKDVQVLLAQYPSLQASANDMALQPQGMQHAEDKGNETYVGIRTRASWAYNSTVELAGHLHQHEGGIMPGKLAPKSVALFETVQLLPDPFERTD